MELPELGSIIAGTVRFLSTREHCSVAGKVLRCMDGEVALHLESPGLPMQVMFAEHRYLARHLPAR